MLGTVFFSIACLASVGVLVHLCPRLCSKMWFEVPTQPLLLDLSKGSHCISNNDLLWCPPWLLAQAKGKPLLERAWDIIECEPAATEKLKEKNFVIRLLLGEYKAPLASFYTRDFIKLRGLTDDWPSIRLQAALKRKVLRMFAALALLLHPVHEQEMAQSLLIKVTLKLPAFCLV